MLSGEQVHAFQDDWNSESMPVPQEVQDIVDRANQAIENGTVQSYLQELRSQRTQQENAAIDRAVQRVTNRANTPNHVVPLTGTSHRLNES